MQVITNEKALENENKFYLYSRSKKKSKVPDIFNQQTAAGENVHFIGNCAFFEQFLGFDI